MKKNIKEYLEELALKGPVFGCFCGEEDYIPLDPKNLSEAKIRSLRHLSISDLELDYLDPVINELKELRWLDISMNNLKKIPELFGLKNLKKISLYSNLLEDLDSIPDWVNMVEGEYNELKQYPQHLRKVKYLHIQQPSVMKISQLDSIYLTLQDKSLNPIEFSNSLRFDFSI